MLIAVAAATISAMAQRAVTGTVTESDTGEPLAMATVKLLKTDSTMVKGGLTATNGSFSVEAPADGKYILQVTCIGFKTVHKNISLSGGRKASTGTIAMEPDAIMLKGATVTGRALKVTTKEDTFVYNASAYRTPEGSVVEELIKRLPGAKIDDDGNITINGKEVKKSLVDGKEFMVGDTKTALKNLPTSIIEKVKSYDEKSDLARVSGIDDGEEQTVLDFGVKKGMNKGLITNTDLAYGTEDRYAARAMAMRFKDKFRVFGFGNAENINGRGFGGRGGRFGGGRRGLQSSKMLGANFNYEEKDGQYDKLKVDGSVRWNHGDGDTRTKNSTENFVSTEGSFSNSLNQSYSRSDSWNAQARLEWHPDTMTTIMFRPTFSLSKSDGVSFNESATFSDDPYLYVSDPLTDDALALMDAEGLAVNSRRQRSISYSESKSVGGMLMFNRRLNSKGRNVTLRLRGNYGDSESNSLSTNNVHLYKTLNQAGQDSTYQTNRYNLTPQKNWDYSVRATYSEPVFKSAFLQFSYEFQYKYTKSDRSTYDFSNLGENFFDGLSPEYRGWDDYLNRLNNPYQSYLDEDLSRFSEYKNYIHDIEVMMRIIRPAYNLNFGVTVMPQQTKFVQRYQGVTTDTTRTVTNITPTVDFRWKISKVSQLRVRYRGSTSQPSMTNLLDITDDSDPLNISHGNPGLKDTRQTHAKFTFQASERNKGTIGGNVNYRLTTDAIAMGRTYDPATGAYTTRPENVNGNWQLWGDLSWVRSFGEQKRFTFDSHTDYNYHNSVDLTGVEGSTAPMRSTVRNLWLGETLRLEYSREKWRAGIKAHANWTHATSARPGFETVDAVDYNFALTGRIELPGGVGFDTDLTLYSRRGYEDRTLNTDDLVWNARLSKSILGGSLTFIVDGFDILGQLSGVTRSLNAQGRTETFRNVLPSYFMAHVVYHLNIEPKKNRK